MVDWRGYVEERLRSLSLTQKEREEFAEELAEHLAEFHEDLLQPGTAEGEAHRLTAARAGDWNEFRRQLRAVRREARMQDRVRQIWIPSFMTLVCSFLILALLQRQGVRILTAHAAEPRGLLYYVPWVLSLPVIGAAAGYLSRRAHGTGWRVYFGAAFPAVATGILFLVTFPFALVVDPKLVPDFRPTSLLLLAANWMIFPALALSTGAALQGLWRRT